ncbi:hypothetical protein NMY22_g12620 [Coprinellus aureogranulatus]|nr:hypothetical protein NMY22_g12620 [Coprinellus aureogranulatus]
MDLNTVNDSPPLAAPMHTLLSNLHLNAQTTLTHLRVVFQNVSYHPPPSTLFAPSLSQLTSLQTFKLDIHIAVPTLPRIH